MKRRASNLARRGTAYLFVLGVTLLVTVLGLGTLSLSRVTARATADGNDWETAGTLAFSATEHAISLLNARAAASPAGWRSGYTSGRAAFAQAVGRGLFCWSVVDETDGNLAADYLRPFRVYGVGVCGGVTRVYSVRVAPAGSALDVLRTALHANGAVKLTGNTRAADGPLSSNNKVTLGGTVNAAVEAASTAGTAAGTQSLTVPSPAKTMPSSAVFDALWADATPVRLDSSGNADDEESGDVVLEKGVLSPAVNPYGTVNAKGLYRLTLKSGKKVTVTDCRIVGTLLVKGSGNVVEVNGPVCWDTGPARTPLLMVSSANATVTIRGSNKWLSEALVGVNFNPVAAPYNGTSNATKTDDYPPHYRGLVHVLNGTGGKVNLRENAYVYGGVLTTGPVDTFDQTTLLRDPSFYNNPPFGYAMGDALAEVPGTWRWDTMPAALVIGPARTAAEATASAAAVSR